MTDNDSPTVGEQRPASERITVAQLLGVIGSADHDPDGATILDVRDALGEAHPAVAGDLARRLRWALDESHGDERGTASGSEHPDWHEGLRQAQENSLEEGYE